MEYQKRYMQVTDGCADCQFLTNAFHLFSLPLTVCSAADVNAEMGLMDCLILCSHLDKQHYQSIYSTICGEHTLVIGLNHQTDFHKQAASHYYPIDTPFQSNEIFKILGACENNSTPELTHAVLHQPLFMKLAGKSKKIRTVKEMILKVADSNATVLLLGQSGTGKDIIASCIHQCSNRRDNPFVPINCGAIPSELMESELFGHEKGAFTGAATRRPGRFELADTGTLFLDEIGDMPMAMQVKLLRVIQDRKIERVGGNQSIDIDVRLIAATNKKLPELIEQGLFREDLFYRLNVFPINVPSLNERSEDIPDIIEHLMSKIEKRVHHRATFTQDSLELLSNYSWPGNIRELENFLERMVILHPDKVIDTNNIDHHYHSNIHAIKNEDSNPRRLKSGTSSTHS